MKKPPVILLLIGVFCSAHTFGQMLKERLILTDTQDSVLLKANTISFDQSGNYCFEVEVNDSEYFYTNTDTIGPFKFIASTYGSGGEIDYTNSFDDKEGKLWYYKNNKGTNIYGPVTGKQRRFMDGHTAQNMAITVSYKDSVFYFVNDKLVSINSYEKAEEGHIENSDWCSFSENGNTIYSARNGKLYSLYVNGKPIDTSYEEFYQLRINNNGQYIFGEGRRPKEKVGKYDYMFFTHSNDTILGPVRTVWECDLKENGGYYYSGDDNGTDYIVINNKLYKNLSAISNITLIDKTNSLFTYKENETQKINVNGKIYTVPFEDIYYPILDSLGHFAFYGMKDFFLYKSINGTPDPDPITKYDVRPIPLYISPEGKTLLYFRTDDSTYIYQDDKLLFPAFSDSLNFSVQTYSDFFSDDYIRGKAQNGNSLFYVQIDSVGYFVFNGKFSSPMIAAKENSYLRKKEPGQIIAGRFDNNGFFIIQKTAEAKFLININNIYYKEISGVDEILRKSNYFDGKKLVFYGIKGLSFYQFTLSL